MRILSIIALTSVLAAGAQAAPLRGVNLSGAEFKSSAIPGKYGWDYLYPKPAEPAYFAAAGATAVRLPLLWERLQPQLQGDLDPAELQRLDTAIDADQANHLATIIDIHNYGRYHGQLLDQGGATSADFADLWRRIAAHEAGRRDVIFGLMNEPQEPDSQQWAATEQQAIDAIRSSGARNMILVSGIAWDGASSFVAKNAEALSTIHDPDHHTIIELHQYFDSDGSGTHPNCVAPDQAVGRLTTATEWARLNHRKLFLGEFGVSRDAGCNEALDAVLTYLDQNADVWRGWTYWAAGPLWGNYPLTVEPYQGTDRPQMTVLRQHLHP